jgi:hypothetical protein
MRNRPGFSLPDVLISLVVMGVIGASLAQVMTVQSRFYQKHEGRGQARAVSRSGTNIIMSDLRMIETGGGIVNASATSIEMLVPFAFGVLCENGAGSGAQYAAMMPVDATMKDDFDGGGNNTEMTGWAWRGSNGAYTYVDAGKVFSKSSLTWTTCTAAGIANTAGSWLIKVGPVPTTVLIGTPIFLYANVTYQFSASAAVPGKIGLWRRLPSRSGPAGQPEEIVAPFDASAAFRFYVGNSSTPVDAPPSPLSDLRGLQLQLTAVNERAGNNNPEELASYTTSVFFKNKM